MTESLFDDRSSRSPPRWTHGEPARRFFYTSGERRTRPTSFTSPRKRKGTWTKRPSNNVSDAQSVSSTVRPRRSSADYLTFDTHLTYGPDVPEAIYEVCVEVDATAVVFGTRDDSVETTVNRGRSTEPHHGQSLPSYRSSRPRF